MGFNGVSPAEDSVRRSDGRRKAPVSRTSANMTEAHVSAQSPPDGGYGWVCVGACFTVNAFTWGVVSVSYPIDIRINVSCTYGLSQSYGVYLAYYLSNESFPDATPVDFAFLGGINFGMAMLTAPLVTVLSRQWGIHVVMLLGAFMQGAGFIGASYAAEVWQLYLSQGALIGIGIGFAYVPSVAVLSQWFEKKRSLASGIAAAGSGIGGIIFSFTTQPMIDNLSLGWSLRIIGIVSSGMLVVATLLMRDRNASIRPKQLGFDRALLHQSQVLLLLSWSFISMLGYAVLLFSLSDFAISIGLPQQQSAQVSGFLNLGTALGRPFIGVLSDRYGRIEVAGLLTFACSVSVFAIWIPANSYGVTVLFAVINGAILGVFWVVSDYILRSLPNLRC
jgi:MFS family permease